MPRGRGGLRAQRDQEGLPQDRAAVSPRQEQEPHGAAVHDGALARRTLGLDGAARDPWRARATRRLSAAVLLRPPFLCSVSTGPVGVPAADRRGQAQGVRREAQAHEREPRAHAPREGGDGPRQRRARRGRAARARRQADQAPAVDEAQREQELVPRAAAVEERGEVPRVQQEVLPEFRRNAPRPRRAPPEALGAPKARARPTPRASRRRASGRARRAGGARRPSRRGSSSRSAPT